MKPEPGLPPEAPSVSRTSVREAVRSAGPATKKPSLFFPLHHLTEGRRCESILPAGHRTASPHSGSRATAAQRSAPERSGAGAERRTGVKRRRGGGGRRTDCFPSDRRDYTLQHPGASTCLWGVKDWLGLLRCSPRCCSAPVGQVEKVSGSVRGLLKGTPVVYCCTKTSLAIRVCADYAGGQ